MDTTNVSRGALIAGISAILLLIFMFFSWYGIDSVTSSVGGFEQEVTAEEFEQFGGLGGADVDTSANAWQAFSLIDLILFLCIAGIAALVILGLVGMPLNLPIAPSAVIAGLGGIALILILFRLIVTPDITGADFGAFGVDVDVDVSRKIGVFLGLLASIGMAVGGWLAMREEGASFGDLGGGTAAGTGAGAAPPPPAPPGQPPGTAEPPPPPPPAGGSQPPPSAPPPRNP